MSERLRYYLRANTGIDEPQLNEILKLFKRISVKRHTTLLLAGEICKEFYFVQSGSVRTYYITKQGHEKSRFIALDGSVATCISSFISQQPSFEFVDALEDSELFVISHHDFFQLVDTVPGWGNYYRTILETAYLYQNKKIENLVTLTAKQRYEKLMSENPEYFQRVSNRILATYLDITQETLSRLKSN